MAFGGGSIGSAYGQIIIETNRAVSNIRALRGDLNNFAQQTQSVGFALATLSRSVLGFAGVLAALPVAGIKFFSDFEEQMKNVASISPEMQANFASISDSVLDLSAETGRSATELASALYDIAQAGFEGAEGLGILTAAANLANAGMTNAKVGAEVLVGILGSGIKDYGGGLLDATKASDLFFQTVFRGNITAEELGQQLGDNLALAQALGVSLPEVLTAYDVLTRQKVLPAEAATQINALMSALLKPTTELQAMFESAGFQNGVQLLQEGYGGETGLVGALKFLDDVLQGDFGQLEDVSGNIRAIRGIVGLLTGDMALWNQEWEAINDSAGATNRALEIQQTSLAYIGRQFRETFKAALIESVEPIVPLIKAILLAGTDLIQMWRDLNDNVKNFVSLLLPIGAAVYGVAGILLTLLSRLYTIRTGLAYLGLGLTTVLGPLGLITIGLTALATMILNNTGGIRDLIQGLFSLFDVLKLLGTTRLNSDDINERLEAYQKLEDLFSTALGPKRAKRIVKALSEVREPTRRLVKQFERMGDAARNFWNIMWDDADSAEIGRFNDRLMALFGPKQGSRMTAQVLRFASAFDNLKESIGETFGVQPWQTEFTRWITDGIAKWGDFATFVRQEVIPTMGDRLESALMKGTLAMDLLRRRLPEIRSGFQAIRTLFNNMIDQLLSGNFRGAMANLAGIFDQIEELTGLDVRGFVLQLRIDAIEWINNAANNVGDFIDDVLSGAGFSTTGEEGTVGFTIGKIAAQITEWAVEGATDLAEQVRQRATQLLGDKGNFGPGEGAGGNVVEVGRVSARIMGWVVTAANDLATEVDNFIADQIGSQQIIGGGGEGPGVAKRQNRALGNVVVSIAKFTIEGAEQLLADVEAWWAEHKDDIREEIFELPELIVQVGTFAVEMLEGAPGLREQLEQFLVLFGIGLLLAPLGIPAIAVTIASILVNFARTALSDAVEWIISLLKLSGVTGEDLADFPVRIGSLLISFARDFTNDFERELRESAIAIEEFTGWDLSLGTPEGGIDASGIAVSIISAIGTALSTLAGDIASMGALSEVFGSGAAIGEAIVSFLANSLETLFATSDMMSQFPKLTGSLALAAVALVGGLAKGIVESIGESFAEEVQSRLGSDASFGDFGKAVAGALLEWALNALEASFAVVNIAGLGFPELARDLIMMIVDGIAGAFRGEDVIIPPSGGMNIDASGMLSGEGTVVGQESLAEQISGIVMDALSGVGAHLSAAHDNPLAYIGEHVVGWIIDAFNFIADSKDDILGALPSWFKKLMTGDVEGAIEELVGGVQATGEATGIDELGDRALKDLAFQRMNPANFTGGPQGNVMTPEQAQEQFGTGFLGILGIAPEQMPDDIDYQIACDYYGVCMTGLTPSEGSPWYFPEDGGAVAKAMKRFADDIRRNKDMLQAILGDEGRPGVSLMGKLKLGGEGIKRHLDDLARNVDSSGGRANDALRRMAQNMSRSQASMRGMQIGGKISAPDIDSSQLTSKLATMTSQIQASFARIRQATSGADALGGAALAGLVAKLQPVGERFAQVGIASGEFRDRVVASLSEARENGNLQLAAMILRAVSFGNEMGVQGARAGASFRQGLAIALLAALGVVYGALNNIRAAVSGFDLYNQGYFIGSSLGLGIARGLNDSLGAVQAAAANLVFAANAAQVMAAKARSPSELTRKEVGQMLGAGVALGMHDMIPEVESSSQDLVYAALHYANGAISNGMGGAVYGSGPSAPVNVYVTVPIDEMDDVKQIIEFFRVMPAQMATI